MIENALSFSKRLTLLLNSNNIENHSIELLNSFFNDVVLVRSQEEVLDKFQDRKIDIVIIDIDENFEEKLETINKIKSLDSNIIIIALSKNKSFELVHKIINLGLNGYLLKPVSIDKLIELLQVLEKKYIKNEEFEDAKQNLTLLQQYQEIADKSSIISKTDLQGKITYANDNFCKISEFSKDELLGKSHNIIRHPDNPKDLYKNLWNTVSVQKKEWSGILKNISKSGKPYYVKSTIKPILDDDGNIVEYIALRDDITNIMNDKKHLLDEIQMNNLSLLILVKIEEFEMLQKFYTIDTIDQIEKTFGFKLLSYLPKRFKFQNVYDLNNGTYALLANFNNFLHKNINITAYLEEFVNNVKKSKLVIDNIEYNLSITLSYSYGKHMLFEDAKSGLEYAINNNLMICHSNDFSIQEQIDAQRNLDVIKMVKIALDDYKIVSYFQPIINNKTKEIEKYESLVRLIDEEGRVISPFEFLSVSKKGSYYQNITDRVLENSFAMLSHIKTKLSINLSTRDIEKKETNEKIFELLEQHKDTRNRLVFEILEDENVKNYAMIKDFIRKVKQMCVKVAIDDFGAGYSNFERLLDFEPDIIKIDGSLVRNLLQDEYNKNLVETIVDFAKKQNIETTAEFVENEEVFNYLCSIGVDYSQGYYFGKPIDLGNTLNNSKQNET